MLSALVVCCSHFISHFVIISFLIRKIFIQYAVNGLKIHQNLHANVDVYK